mgnify:FL=1
MKEASLSIVEDVENGRYLMIRNHRGINKGCLNFPGGKKEPGEDMRACVKILKNMPKRIFSHFREIFFFLYGNSCIKNFLKI